MPSCILTCYYRPKPGGFCKRLFRTIEALLARGHSVHYLAVVPFPIEHPNCHFHRFPWPADKTSGYLFWAVFHLLSPLLLLYLSFSCSVDRLFAFGHTYSFLFQPARIIKRISLALFLRADTVKNHQIKKRHSLLINIEYFLEGLGIVGTDMYGVSQVLTNAVQSRHSVLIPKSTGLLRNEIPQLSYKKKKDKQFNRSSLHPLRGACVGVLEKRKNQLFLLKIFEHIQAEQMRLFLYGTGPDEELLQHIVRKGNIAKKIIFKGWVKAEQIWPETDLLLMPSQHEGAPNAVLEALATGTPVLASDIPEHREILPPTCLLPLADEDAWIKKLYEIAEYPEAELNQLIAAQESASKHLRFDWDEKIVRCILGSVPTY
ncbi:MAG: glycosyltransferase family 4 protein [Candidatus Electrothrix scaldis]|nr:MAG: glycosyltransferase family 4 protein [Candidatus Electrothrix sp. GW3-3]